MAGDSAQRKYEQIRDGRRGRVGDNWQLLVVLTVVAIGGGALAMNALIGTWWLGVPFGLVAISQLLVPTRQEVAWRKGADGERAVGRALDQLGPPSVAIHDRRIPRSRANIDHILMAPTGVWTVDAKNYTGKLETRRRGTELWIKGRNRSKLLAQAERQVAVVSETLGAAGLAHVRVRPALCFLGVEWPLLFRPKRVRDVALVSPRRLGTLAEGEQTMSPAEMQRVRAVLDSRLRPATDSTATNWPVPAGRASSTARATPPDTASAPPPVSVKPWKRYGKHRLYVNTRDGDTLGYVDMQSNEVVPSEEHHRAVVRDAAAEYLRNS